MAFKDKLIYIWNEYFKDYSVNESEIGTIKTYWEKVIISEIRVLNVEKMSTEDCANTINKLLYKNSDEDFVLLVGNLKSGTASSSSAKDDLKMIKAILTGEEFNSDDLKILNNYDHKSVKVSFIFKRLIIDNKMDTFRMTDIPKNWKDLFEINSLEDNYYENGIAIMNKVYDFLNIEKDDDGNYKIDPETCLKIYAMLWWMKEQEEKNAFNVIDKMDSEYKNTAFIFHGAPGTGKTYSIKEHVKMACKYDPIDNTYKSFVTEEAIKQWSFVQFHSSYDYSDFVEGLRPALLDEGQDPTFVKKDGVFKEFCRRVAEYNMNEYLNGDGKKIFDELKKKNEKELESVLKLKAYLPNKKVYLPKKRFYFIIDEINRADLGKVFGELMYAFESDYRDEEFDTQYMNLPTFYAKDKNATTVEKIPADKDIFADGFFVPKNVYIIGSMNDIDRSVETFDFALRRRFQWKDIKANDIMKNTLEDMFRKKKEARDNTKDLSDMIIKMNKVISGENKSFSVNGSLFGLNASYHIGPAYFKDYDGTEKSLNIIWNEKIEPAIREYVRGDRRTDDVETFIMTNCKSQLGLGVDEIIIKIVDKLNEKIIIEQYQEKGYLDYELFIDLNSSNADNFDYNWKKVNNRIDKKISNLTKKEKPKYSFLFNNGQLNEEKKKEFLELCKVNIEEEFRRIWEEEKSEG